MSIGEFAGGSTATQLGIRSMGRSTSLSVFAREEWTHWRADRPADVLRDGAAFEVDLDGQRPWVRSWMRSPPPRPPPSRSAAPVGPTGRDRQQSPADRATGGTGRLQVESANGSLAADQLGLLASVADSTLTGADRARVEVESVFTHLSDLRTALLEGDQGAIGRLVERIQDDIDRAASARARAGHRSRMVSDAIGRFESRNITDETIRSQLRDVDYTDASMRFATLQQQLQASLATTARISSLSLMDFLG